MNEPNVYDLFKDDLKQFLSDENYPELPIDLLAQKITNWLSDEFLDYDGLKEIYLYPDEDLENEDDS